MNEDVNRLTRNNQIETDRLEAEITRLRGELNSAGDLKTELLEKEDTLQDAYRELKIARDNLTILQNQSSASVNQQATLVATLQTYLQTAKDTLGRNLAANDALTKNLRKQISDLTTEVQTLKSTDAVSHTERQELLTLRQKDQDNQRIITGLRTKVAAAGTATTTMGTPAELSKLVAIPLREKIPNFSLAN